MRPIALVTDIDWEGLALEKDILESAGFEVVLAEDPSESTLTRLAADASVILVCFATLPASVITAASNTTAILRYGGGVNNIDLAATRASDIRVYNVPDFCVEEVADHALMLILALSRGLERQINTTRDGGWAMPGELPRRLSTQTLGLVGMGRTGVALARRAHALGMAILFTMSSRDIPPDIPATRVSDLETLAAQVDVLSLHVPMTPEYEGIIDARILQKMKPTATLINVARGGLVATDDLVEALEQGWIAQAGLDVTQPEPLPESHPLRGLASCVITPHFAYRSEESILEVRARVARAARDILTGHTPDPGDVSLVG
jgi:D-3-phosphoglycerate dehydrogenase